MQGSLLNTLSATSHTTAQGALWQPLSTWTQVADHSWPLALAKSWTSSPDTTALINRVLRVALLFPPSPRVKPIFGWHREADKRQGRTPGPRPTHQTPGDRHLKAYLSLSLSLSGSISNPLDHRGLPANLYLACTIRRSSDSAREVSHCSYQEEPRGGNSIFR